MRVRGGEERRAARLQSFHLFQRLRGAISMPPDRTVKALEIGRRVLVVLLQRSRDEIAAS